MENNKSTKKTKYTWAGKPLRDYHNTITQGLTPQTSMYNIAVDSNGNMYYQSGNQWLPTLETAKRLNLPISNGMYAGATMNELPVGTQLIKKGEPYYTEGQGDDLIAFPRSAYDWSNFEKELEFKNGYIIPGSTEVVGPGNSGALSDQDLLNKYYSEDYEDYLRQNYLYPHYADNIEKGLNTLNVFSPVHYAKLVRGAVSDTDYDKPLVPGNEWLDVPLDFITPAGAFKAFKYTEPLGKALSRWARHADHFIRPEHYYGKLIRRSLDEFHALNKRIDLAKKLSERYGDRYTDILEGLKADPKSKINPVDLSAATPELIAHAAETGLQRDGGWTVHPMLQDGKVEISPDKSTLTIISDPKDAGSFGTTGDYGIIDYETGLTHTGNVSIGSVEPMRINYTLGLGNPIRPIQYENIPQTISTSSSSLNPSVTGDIRSVLLKNIDYVTGYIPGFKPFGSSVSVANGNLAHITHDIDGYMTREAFNAFARQHPVMRRNVDTNGLTWDDLLRSRVSGYDGNSPTYITMINDGKYGEQGMIDINVIDIAPDGTANSRAQEMYRQFFPDEYLKQVKELAAAGVHQPNGVKILDINGNPMTNQQLLDGMDPVRKSIMDSLEINFSAPQKEKHAGRVFNYLMGDNTQDVHDAMMAVARMQSGENARLLPKLKIDKYDESIYKGLLASGYSEEDAMKEAIQHAVNKNIQHLINIGYEPNVAKAIAQRGPENVLNAIDYWYLADNTYYRAVNAGDIHEDGGTVDKLMRNLSLWNPQAGGGTASGAGLNTTVRGTSGHTRAVSGYLQPNIAGLYEDMPANDAIRLILKLTRNSGTISAEDAKWLNSLLGKPDMFAEGDYLGTILHTIPSDNKKIFDEIINHFDLNSLSANEPYGNGLYAGLRDLDPATDAIGTTAGDIVDPQYSYRGIPTLFDRTSKMNHGNLSKSDARVYWDNIFTRRGRRYSKELDDVATRLEHWRKKRVKFIDHASTNSHNRRGLVYRRDHAKKIRNAAIGVPLIPITSYGMGTALGHLINFYRKNNESFDEQDKNYLNTPTGAEDYRKLQEEIKTIDDSLKLLRGNKRDRRKLIKKRRLLIDDYEDRVIEYYGI